MSWETLVQASITATAGLAGVALGGYLTYWREQKAEKRKQAQNLGYLVVLVVANLRELADTCLALAYDNGCDEQGRPNGKDDVYEANVQTPVFKPRDLDVEWKELPLELMNAVFTLPNRIEDIRAAVAHFWDMEGRPFDGGFEVRQLEFAKLGVGVCELIIKMRGLVRLEDEERVRGEPSQWARMKKRLDELEERRRTIEAENKRSEAFFKDLKENSPGAAAPGP